MSAESVRARLSVAHCEALRVLPRTYGPPEDPIKWGVISDETKTVLAMTTYEADADLIAHAPRDLLAALDVIEAARQVAAVTYNLDIPELLRLNQRLDAFEALP